MSATLSVVERLQPRSEPNAVLSQDQRGRAYAETLKKLVKTAPEQLSVKDIVFFLLSSIYDPEFALSATPTVLQSGSLGHILTDAGVKLRERSPHLSDFWLLCEVVRTMMKQISLDEMRKKTPKLKSWHDVADYIRLTLAYEKDECFRILHLDRENHLLEDELHSRGSTNQVPIYPIKVIKSVLERGSSAVMLLHNHPSHSTAVSEPDIVMTRQLEQALNSVEVLLHDHVIVCGPHYVSMRGMGLLGA